MLTKFDLQIGKKKGLDPDVENIEKVIIDSKY